MQCMGVCLCVWLGRWLRRLRLRLRLRLWLWRLMCAWLRRLLWLWLKVCEVRVVVSNTRNLI